MKGKRILGLVLLVLGIVAIIYANYQKGRVSQAKSDINKGTSAFSIGGNSTAEGVGSHVGSALQAKASQYDTPLMWIQIGGVVFVIAGIALAVCCRKR